MNIQIVASISDEYIKTGKEMIEEGFTVKEVAAWLTEHTDIDIEPAQE